MRRLHTARMGKVTENITVVQTRHCNFGDHHFEEGRECGEDAKLIVVESEAGGGREVASFHDSGGHEDFGVLLVDDLQSGRSLQIAIDDHDLLCGLFFAEGVEDEVDRLAKDNTVGTIFFGRADIEVGRRNTFDVEEDVTKAGVSSRFEVLYG